MPKEMNTPAIAIILSNTGTKMDQNIMIMERVMLITSKSHTHDNTFIYILAFFSNPNGSMASGGEPYSTVYDDKQGTAKSTYNSDPYMSGRTNVDDKKKKKKKKKIDI